MASVSLTQGAADTVERDARGRIRLTSAGNRNMSVQLTLLVLAVLTVVTFVRMDFGSTDLAAATSQALSDFYAMMVQPALDPPLGASHFTWEILIESALITLAITAICTVISAIVSFFLALAASENLSNPAVSNAVKGFVAVILSHFGVTQNVNLLNDPDYVLWTLSFITVWQMAGYFMVLFLTGLVQIPTELYDAAKVDGARSPASLFANITWPLLGPTSFFIVILTIIKTFQVFDIVKVLTRGRPERASAILLYTMYQEGFSFFRMGTAAAIAALYLAVMLFLTWLQTHFIGRRVHYGFQ